MPQLHIRKLNILIRQSRHARIADYVPLLRALKTLPAVHFGTVTIEVNTPLTLSETDVIAAICTDLTAALHTARLPTDNVISAFDAFKNARSRVQQAINNHELCCYTVNLELEQLRNFIQDDVLRASRQYSRKLLTIDREPPLDDEDAIVMARRARTARDVRGCTDRW